MREFTFNTKRAIIAFCFLMGFIYSGVLSAQNPAYRPPAKHCTKNAEIVTISWKEIIVTELKRREGFASRPYKDKECWTIGYGLHIDNWADMPKYPIAECQAELIMDKRLMADYENVAQVFPHYTENEKWALTSLVYNKGMTNVKSNKALWDALHLKDKKALEKLWMSEFSNTTNHKYSRELEWALFTMDEPKLRALYEASAVIVENRNARKVDFSCVKKPKPKKK